MCAGAIYWSGVSRVIFGLAADRLTQLVDGTTEKTLSLTAERVLNSGGRRVAVIGPVLEEEALAVHLGFWKP